MIASIALAACMFIGVWAIAGRDGGSSSSSSDKLTAAKPSDSVSTVVTSSEPSASDTVSEEQTSSEEQASSEGQTSSSEATSSEETKVPSTKPTVSESETTTERPIDSVLFPGYKYNTELDIEDNVFLDALTYTGYNLEKHRSDGLMWTYILSKDKKHRGWLSNITYGAGSSGQETTSDGLPNIKCFEKHGLVCASFATYVYFNYLPNVAKIDTSCLDIPERSYNAQSFYLAAQKWLQKGYTYNIGFTAKNEAGGIKFTPDEEIPIGSIIVFRDLDSPGKKEADHITIYVGEKNGYHWVIQTGNKNGPEFCAVERFKFGPDPQWPLKIFATPTCIYDAIGATSGAAENS